MYEIPKVEGAIDKSRISIRVKTFPLFGTTEFICYDDVALWATACNLDQVDIFLAEPSEPEAEDEEKEPYVLICRDSFGDCYTYGRWNTLEEALQWLDTPVALY